MIRAATSVEPPAGRGTMKWIGRFGQSSAKAVSEVSAASIGTKKIKRNFISKLLFFHDWCRLAYRHFPNSVPFQRRCEMLTDLAGFLIIPSLELTRCSSL